MQITVTINGKVRTLDVDPRQRLSHLLRDSLDLTGLKEGCQEGECGACTVLLDGLPVNSCLMLAFQANGCVLTTIEGLKSADGGMSSLQRSFVEHGAVQCGYCTPGMVMAAEGLLRQNPSPDAAAITHALAGNLCRCTGYQTIVEAVTAEAARRHGSLT
jgi:aerobic carbon-monoxide dehydrogenase small subunit